MQLRYQYCIETRMYRITGRYTYSKDVRGGLDG